MTKDQSSSSDLHLHNYQDDLDATENDSTLDEFTLKETGELSAESGIDKKALKEDFGEDLNMEKLEQTSNPEDDDKRENLEDQDEDLVSR